MADTQEQLLSELLDTIAREDASLEASDLETRVLAACEAAPPARTGRRWIIAGAAAAILVAGLTNATLQRGAAPPASAPPAAPPMHADSTASVDPVPPRPRRAVSPRKPEAAVAPVSRSQAHVEALVQSPAAPLPVKNQAIEFIPLLPLSEHELTGSFQIMRVQMPRASLGPLAPLDVPGDIVEADVLLGEDGTARAIRVSTGQTLYPWRTR